MKPWDAFISHATEDKAAVAAPLCHELRRAGVRIWLDAFEIKVGDSVRRKIDDGLANSRYGVVIASPRFFEKDWASAELDALFASGHVLPILHDLELNALKKISPLLAGKAALSTALGMDIVAKRLAERIFAPSLSGTGAAQAFARVLVGIEGNGRPSIAAMREVFSTALRLRTRDILKSDIEFGEWIVDFCAGRYQDSTARHEDWAFVFCGAPSVSLFDVEGAETPELAELLDKATNVRRWVRDNFSRAREILPTLRLDYPTTVVLGRREQPGSRQAAQLAELNDSLLECRVRTYDWALDELIRGRDGD